MLRNTGKKNQLKKCQHHLLLIDWLESTSINCVQITYVAGLPFIEKSLPMFIYVIFSSAWVLVPGPETT